MSDVALALTEQAARHVECAKAELASEARMVGRDLLPMVVGVPLLCVGYVFVCIAASSSLAVAIGPLAAGAVVGVANLVAGLIGVRFTYVQLRERRSNRLTADGDVPEAAGKELRDDLARRIQQVPETLAHLPQRALDATHMMDGKS